MIFVTTGTCEPFDRLLHALDELVVDEELIVQHGHSRVRPPRARCVDFLAYDELVEVVRNARVVVTHAGVGSVLTALANGKRPIVVPRLAVHGDAVDDHQLEFARRLAANGVITLLEEPGRLSELLAANGSTNGTPIAPDRRLVSELRAFLLARS